MNKEWELVKKFHEKFGHPISDSPSFMKKERALKRFNWMLEEINEFIEADNIYDQADAMIDLIYFALGTMVEIGIKPKQIFNIVHQANMNKLFSDNKPHYSSEGKTIKPKGWVDPYDDIKKEIDKLLQK